MIYVKMINFKMSNIFILPPSDRLKTSPYITATFWNCTFTAILIAFAHQGN